VFWGVFTLSGGGCFCCGGVGGVFVCFFVGVCLGCGGVFVVYKNKSTKIF